MKNSVTHTNTHACKVKLYRLNRTESHHAKPNNPNWETQTLHLFFHLFLSCGNLNKMGAWEHKMYNYRRVKALGERGPGGKRTIEKWW